MPFVTAVCRVAQLLPDPGAVGVTAIDKRPVDGPLPVKKLGLYGDVQASRKHHGGPDQAVYVYADEDAAFWAAELGRDITPGLLGENLRVAGVDVNAVLVGERWRIGDTLVLEATSPRTPCATFARRMDVPGLVKRFADAGRPGTYFRVVTTGPVAAGDPVTVLERPSHGVSIRDIFPQVPKEPAEALLAAAAGDELVLHPTLRREAEAAVARA